MAVRPEPSQLRQSQVRIQTLGQYFEVQFV